MTLDIPVFNEDGSIKFTQTIGPEEAQHLLQFALNILTAAGLSAVQGGVAQIQQAMND